MEFKGLTKIDKKQLEFEVISEQARLKLTRLLRKVVSSGDEDGSGEVRLVRQNRIVNMARSVIGLAPYVLNSDSWGNYELAEAAWHNGEIEMVMRRPDTAELIETIGDLLQDTAIDTDEVNEILEEENVSFKFERTKFHGDISVNIFAIDKIGTEEEKEHLNVRVLVDRMDKALESNDTGGVLHASASIFETLAKDIVNVKSIANQTLASFFEKYRKISKLPEPVLDYILDIYKLRNTEPLAGHGSTLPTNITKEEAIFLVEMTKAFVRIERQLAIIEVNIKKIKQDNKK
ncbi:MAG: hypothetical protein KKC39_02875 [Candidatus Omnitrophica bacterium]|nr:hypothetical protein [Candidatus Omnitrophota bacterium]MCG2707497.1 hypothetical protein [Candidatus Omnitrophota bacterium]